MARENEIAICVVGPEQPKTPNLFTAFDVPVYFLASDQKLKHRTAAAKIQATMRLRKRITAFGPDVVHAFGTASTLIAAAGLGLDRKTKLVSSILSKWQPQTTINQWIESRLIQRVDRFIVAHDCLKAELLDFGIPETQCSVLANAVDHGGEASDKDDQLQRRRRALIDATGVDPSAFIAVSSAALEPVTRLKDLIWATDLLSCVRDDVHLVIFGAGTQHQRLLKFAACTEAEQHIHFAGLPANADILIGGADVYWNSHLQTPLPCSVLTAMNFGVPVISVYGPETAPLILHQETGFAVNFGARDEFARWTKFLIEKPEAAQQISDQGQQHIRRCFSGHEGGNEIEKIYAGLSAPATRTQ